MSAVGFLLADGDVALPDRWWWAEVALAGARGWLVAIPAEAGAPANEGSAFFSARFGEAAQEFCDPAAGRYRAASLAEDRVQAALFLEPAGAFPSWEALIALMRSGALEADARFNLLSGCSTAGLAAAGPSVCACFGVGLTAISAAIASGEARSVDDVGRLLKAGTNCGSCQPEIRRLLASAGASHVAA